jgi:hypothetical protein
MLVCEGHEHLQIEHIQFDLGDKGREGQVGGEPAQIGAAKNLQSEGSLATIGQKWTVDTGWLSPQNRMHQPR